MTQGPHWLEKVHAHMRDLYVVREGMIVGKLFNVMVADSIEITVARVPSCPSTPKTVGNLIKTRRHLYSTDVKIKTIGLELHLSSKGDKIT